MAATSRGRVTLTLSTPGCGRGRMNDPENSTADDRGCKAVRLVPCIRTRLGTQQENKSSGGLVEGGEMKAQEAVELVRLTGRTTPSSASLPKAERPSARPASLGSKMTGSA